ncbi:acyltransferase [Larkinella terrae]|uniref:Acyltransferase n=1 Tax=Larkinella terrae TaxID=2025311 RepID=A0A7K0EUU5_9BACT|nr:acyltransferase [Larkinella terrae]MRS65529.1 acyltransferase [Larkinella terrae]
MMERLRTLKTAYTKQFVQWYSRFLCSWVKFRYPNVNIGSNVSIYGKIIFRVDKTAQVTIGNNVIFRSSTRSNFAGICKYTSIFVGKNATLTIGDFSGFSGVSIYCSKEISIGSYCILGVNSNVWDTDFHPLDYKLRRTQLDGAGQSPIRIENDVFVGGNSTLLKGVTIGSRSIIGTSSVVTKSIPADQIWAGNPARYIRQVAN